MTDEYVNVTVRSYGFFDTQFAKDLVSEVTFAQIVAEGEARKAYYNSPEGKEAERKFREEQEILWEKQQRFRKKWQPLHDWLTKNGCYCENDY